MVGRATRLVLYLGWPCALALLVAAAGLQLGHEQLPPERRLSTEVYGKFEALSVCVESVTGERRDAAMARDLVASSLAGIALLGPRRFTVPAVVDAGCPREAAHFGTNARARRVAGRAGSSAKDPSPYHLHVYLMPSPTLRSLGLEPGLGDRRLLIEEYVVEGVDATALMTGVTYGLYAAPEELRDGGQLHRFFRQALTLQSQLGAPPRARS